MRHVRFGAVAVLHRAWLAGAMDKTETPRNQEGQPPTRSAADTEERLGEKEHADRGQANKDRIEAKISALKD